MTLFHTALDLSGHSLQEFIFTFRLTGSVTEADVGKPVAIDPAEPNAVRLAANNDIILGRLETVEVRPSHFGGAVGAVAFKFIQQFPVLAADPLAVGDTAVSGGNGTIKRAPAPNNPDRNFVVAVANGVATLAKL